MVKYDPNIHHRRSIRLKGYDYSRPGLYFVTIVTQNRRKLFGEIKNGKMILNDAGKMVENEWLKLPERFQNIRLHQYIVMPNHFHAILEITAPDNGGESLGQPLGQPRGIAPTDTPTESPTGNPTENQKRKTLGDMMGAFQSIVTNEYIRGVKNKNWERFDRKLWQRNYWEHIIRDKRSFDKISEYIKNNPKKWDDDRLYKNR